MKLPDLHDTELAGVHAWHGDAQALRAAATAAKLASTVNLAARAARTRCRPLKGTALPDHFGNNWDVADRSKMKNGLVTRRHFSITHPPSIERLTPRLDDARGHLAEAADWRERHKTSGVRRLIVGRRTNATLPLTPMSFPCRTRFRFRRWCWFIPRTCACCRRAYRLSGHWQSVTGSQERAKRWSRRRELPRKPASTPMRMAVSLIGRRPTSSKFSAMAAPLSRRKRQHRTCFALVGPLP